MAAEQSDFSQILNSLLSVDNALRQSAEVSDLNGVSPKKYRMQCENRGKIKSRDHCAKMRRKRVAKNVRNVQ